MAGPSDDEPKPQAPAPATSSAAPAATPAAATATTQSIPLTTPSSTTASAVPGGNAATASAAAAAAAPKRNPAFAAMGLPNFRMRLPSRNWSIFLTIVGSWTAALVYDRRQKKKVQQKWCALVEHIAREPLATNELLRKVTVVLAAPPGDGLRSAREHFTEYVKPVLAAGALDWDVIEGRREGDIRAGVAERIRRLRRRHGEPAGTSVELDKAAILADFRTRAGTRSPGDTVAGDIVIGRHTWKEYIRGLHEGWLGPIDPPPEPDDPSAPSPSPEMTPSASISPMHEGTPAENTSELEMQTSTDGNSSLLDPTSENPSSANSADTSTAASAKESEKPKKPKVPPPHIDPSAYETSQLPPSIPWEFQPSNAIAFPHVLGFLKTPVRMYRFLTRRHLADDIGRQTAAIVLAAHRPWREGDVVESAVAGSADSGSVDGVDSTGQSRRWEQQRVLFEEEQYWPKAVRQPKKQKDGAAGDDESRERLWIADMAVDPRIGCRMRRFEVEPWEEERARAIWSGSKGLPGRRDDDGQSEH